MSELLAMRKAAMRGFLLREIGLLHFVSTGDWIKFHKAQLLEAVWAGGGSPQEGPPPRLPGVDSGT